MLSSAKCGPFGKSASTGTSRGRSASGHLPIRAARCLGSMSQAITVAPVASAGSVHTPNAAPMSRTGAGPSVSDSTNRRLYSLRPVLVWPRWFSVATTPALENFGSDMCLRSLEWTYGRYRLMVGQTVDEVLDLAHRFARPPGAVGEQLRAAEADDRHAGRGRRPHPDGAVLDRDAVGGIDAQPRCGVEVDVGRRYPPKHIRGRVHPAREVVRQPGDLEIEQHKHEKTERDHTGRHRE